METLENKKMEVIREQLDITLSRNYDNLKNKELLEIIDNYDADDENNNIYKWDDEKVCKVYELVQEYITSDIDDEYANAKEEIGYIRWYLQAIEETCEMNWR